MDVLRNPVRKQPTLSPYRPLRKKRTLPARTLTYPSAAGIRIVELDRDHRVFPYSRVGAACLMPSAQIVPIVEALNVPIRLKENRKSGPFAARDDLLLGWCVCWEPLHRCCEGYLFIATADRLLWPSEKRASHSWNCRSLVHHKALAAT